MGDNPSFFQGKSLPVEQISWMDAQAFIKKMNGLKPELKLCLPSEVEWEYCCRAGTETIFSFGKKDDLNLERVNYSGEWSGIYSEGSTKKVKSYAPNSWGLYEMHGNVWEWCHDFLGIPKISSKGLVYPESLYEGSGHIIRGGSWFNSGRYCRSAVRRTYKASERDNSIGEPLKTHHAPK